MIDIKQGATFQGGSAYLGVPFMAIGLLMTIYGALHDLVFVLLALPIFAMGLIIFMVRRGRLIDTAAKRFKPYRDLVLLRIGPWIPLEGIASVRVKRERETYSHNPNGAGIMQNRTAFWCFNVTLHGNGPVKMLFLKEFHEPGAALALGEQLAKALGIPLEDGTAAPRPSSRSRR